MKNVTEYHMGQVGTNTRHVISMPLGAYVCCAYILHGYVYLSVLQDTDQPYSFRTFRSEEHTSELQSH